MEKIESLIKRLKNIGVGIELTMNFPWIYVEKINNKKVTETFLAEHGFTIAFMPIKKDQKLKFADITKLFKLLRKYK